MPGTVWPASESDVAPKLVVRDRWRSGRLIAARSREFGSVPCKQDGNATGIRDNLGMRDRLVYVSRLVRLPLVGADGAEIGHMADVVLTPPGGGGPPQVIGFVVAVQRRRVFVGAGRVAEIEVEGVRLRRGTINLRQFELRAGEQLVAGELFRRKLCDQRIVDAAITPGPAPYSWELATIALSGGGLPGRRRPPEVVDWSEAGELFANDPPAARQAAAIGQLHPVEMADHFFAGATARVADIVTQIVRDAQ